MNGNLLRTILSIFSGTAFISIAAELAGCKGTELATASCGASWIPIEYQAMAGAAFVVLGFLFKMFGGSGATVVQNIAAPVVPVVPAVDAGPGVVTATQVSSTKP